MMAITGSRANMVVLGGWEEEEEAGGPRCGGKRDRYEAGYRATAWAAGVGAGASGCGGPGARLLVGSRGAKGTGVGRVLLLLLVSVEGLGARRGSCWAWVG